MKPNLCPKHNLEILPAFMQCSACVREQQSERDSAKKVVRSRKPVTGYDDWHEAIIRQEKNEK